MSGVLAILMFDGDPQDGEASPATGRAADPLNASHWREIGGTWNWMILLRIADEAAANEAMREFVDNAGKALEQARLPIAVTHIQIEHVDGAILDNTAIGSYLSMAQSQADPGYGKENREQVEELLTTFRLLDEYSGHIQGFKVGLEDETWSLVFWRSHPAPATPENSRVRLSHFQRVA